MTSLDYRGGTPSKDVARHLVWLQHRRLLNPRAFLSQPHVFLASRYAGDIDTLLSMGVPPKNVWAVEKERREYNHLFDRQAKQRFLLHTEKVELLAERFAGTGNLRSVFLDFCGNLQGTQQTTRRVVSHLPVRSALSVTLFLGRERHAPESREDALLQEIRANTRHAVTLVQSVLYSSHDVSMGVWTFYLGPWSSRSKMAFNLGSLAAERVANSLWGQQLSTTKVRSQAAVKANVTRRRRR